VTPLALPLQVGWRRGHHKQHTGSPPPDETGILPFDRDTWWRTGARARPLGTLERARTGVRTLDTSTPGCASTPSANMSCWCLRTVLSQAQERANETCLGTLDWEVGWTGLDCRGADGQRSESRDEALSGSRLYRELDSLRAMPALWAPPAAERVSAAVVGRALLLRRRR
jgi:hypothetical protein